MLYTLVLSDTTLWRYTNLFIIIFFDPGTQFPGMKKNYAMQYKQVQKSSWNEPYSSSFFAKQSCSKMASESEQRESLK